MAHSRDLAPTPLARHSLLTLPQGRGHAVAVFEGCVWITEAGDAMDKVLGAGDSLVLQRPGLAIVHALRDSQVMIFETGALPFSGGATAGAASMPRERPDRAAVERTARELRAQAIAAALRTLVQWVRRSFARAVGAARG